MPVHHFKCSNCGFKWTGAADPKTVRCVKCPGVAHTVSARKQRKGAKTVLDVSTLNVHSRTIRKKTRRDIGLTPKQLAFLAEQIGEDDDEDDDMEVDNEFLPSPAFNPALRFSGTGEFDKIPVFPGHTTTKATPWTTIGPPAGRQSTAAQFGGETAEQHGQKFAPHWKGAPSISGNSNFEWCHLIADSLGGATTANNLFCGTYHANTAMLCIESVLRAQTQLEVKVDVTMQLNSHLGLIIDYQVRNPNSGKIFSTKIDGLATGCMLGPGKKLSGEVKSWIGKHGR
jgi:hypothetical protein